MRKERGASILESAIIFPLLILLVFGCLQYGNAIWTRIAVNNVAAELARRLIVETKDVTRDDIIAWGRDYATKSNLMAANLDVPSATSDANKIAYVTVAYQLPLFAAWTMPGNAGGVKTFTTSFAVKVDHNVTG